MDDAPTPRVAHSIGTDATVEALAHALEVWDAESFRHSVNTLDIAVAIAHEMGFEGEAEGDPHRILGAV